MCVYACRCVTMCADAVISHTQFDAVHVYSKRANFDKVHYFLKHTPELMIIGT